MTADFQRDIPGVSVSCGARGFWAEAGHPMGAETACWGRACAVMDVVCEELIGGLWLCSVCYYCETEKSPLFGCELSPSNAQF